MNAGMKIKVTMVRRNITSVRKESPQASVWYEVTDLKHDQVTKCVQHMYHTKQTIHLQGGKRMGNVTTTSLVADLMEKEWSELIDMKKEAIKSNTEAISKIDVTKFEEELKNEKDSKKTEIKTKYDCDKCDFKSVFYFEIERHLKILHQTNVGTKRCYERKRVRFNNDVKDIIQEIMHEYFGTFL